MITLHSITLYQCPVCGSPLIYHALTYGGLICAFLNNQTCDCPDAKPRLRSIAEQTLNHMARNGGASYPPAESEQS